MLEDILEVGSECVFVSPLHTRRNGAHSCTEIDRASNLSQSIQTQKILKPLDDLASLRSPDERVPFYFRVSCADVYMLGVVIFWIWSEGGIWRCSDPRQDEK